MFVLQVIKDSALALIYKTWCAGAGKTYSKARMAGPGTENDIVTFAAERATAFRWKNLYYIGYLLNVIHNYDENEERESRDFPLWKGFYVKERYVI